MRYLEILATHESFDTEESWEQRQNLLGTKNSGHWRKIWHVEFLIWVAYRMSQILLVCLFYP